MTTVYQLTPTPNAPYQFAPTLDGQVYNVVVPFLGVGQRFYLNIFTLSNTLVAAVPVIASPSPINIQNISWSGGYVILTTISPHNYDVGTTLNLTVSGCVPDVINGTFSCLVTGPSKIRYALATDPGPITTTGAVGQNINLLAGYFSNTTMFFREGTNYFEVS